MENIKVNKERVAPGRSPFHAGFDPQCFFPGGGREELLAGMLSAIADSATFMTLEGVEGCGKTSMCIMVEKSLPNDCIPIYFPKALQSFESLSRGLAKAMRISLADPAAGDIRELLLEVWERLQEKGQRIVLIFDQAEQINPAILDRIRKMLDILNNTGIVFQTLFAGRPGLQESLSPLSLCSFPGAKEMHFVLELLDASATSSYLNFCMNRGANDGMGTITPEMSEEIFRYAGGNINMTNAMADKSLQALNDDTSFMVLLDNVKDTAPERPVRRRRPPSSSENYLTNKKFLIPACSVFVLLVLILMIMRMSSTSDSRKGEQPVSSQAKMSLESRDSQSMPEGVKNETASVDKVPNGNDSTPAGAEVESQPAADLPTTAELPSQPAGMAVEKMQTVESKPEASPMRPPEMPKAVEEKKDVQKKVEVKKISPAPPPRTPTVEKTAVPKKTPPPEKVAAAKRIPADKLYAGRVAASAKWLIGEKKDRFTIQLMVLASEGAEKSVKNMLVQQQYQDIAGHLYILRRAGSPPMVLMFYGEYKTLADAKNAKNSLPASLLKNNPYPISVQAAVKKASGG